MELSRKFILQKLTALVIHTLFWIAVLFFYTYFFGHDTNNFNYALSFSLFLMPVTIGTTYTLIDRLIPKYLLQKRYATFTLYGIYTLIISAFFITISFFYGLIFLSAMDINGMPPLTKSPVLLFIAVYFIVFIASIFSLVKQNFTQTDVQQELRNKILETQLQLKAQELQYLKNQIHPHFLFNTLNTMYGFALKKSQQTPEMILKLSNLLDYLLYQTEKTSVSIEEEIDHLNDYLDLEKMRFRDTLEVSLNFKDIPKHQPIAPMLFLPFVENSFKHGNIVNGKLKIYIEISSYDDQISFLIKNTTDDTSNRTDSHGIGLTNIQKRLELLYPNRYELEIGNENNWFSAHLLLKPKTNG